MENRETLIRFIEDGLSRGGWVIFTGHEIGRPKDRLNTDGTVLSQTLAYLADRRSDFWVATVGQAAQHIAAERRKAM